MKFRINFLLIVLTLFSEGICIAAAEVPAANASSEADQKIYRITEVDKKPVVKKRSIPNLPYGVSRAGAQVAVLIDVKGNVTKAELVNSSNKRFGEMAVDAAKKHSFTPAEKNGRAVQCVNVVTFEIDTSTTIH